MYWDWADSTNAFKKLGFACGGYVSVRDWNSFASSSKIFSLLKCLKLKRAPSCFANGIDLCYRLSLLFQLVTAFTSSLWRGGICCCLIISRHRCFTYRSFPFILAAPFNHPRIRGITSQLFSCQTSACCNPVNKSNLQLSGHTFVYKQSVGDLTLAQFLKHVIIPQKPQALRYKYSKTPHWRFQKKAKS